MEEKQQRVYKFTAWQEDVNNSSWPKHSRKSLDVVSTRAGGRDAEPESSAPAPSIASFPPGSFLFTVQNLEFGDEKEIWPLLNHLPSLANSPISCGSLLCNLLEIN